MYTFLKKMKRQTMTRKRIPRMTVKASQVSLCFRKSSMISGVKFSCNNVVYQRLH